MKRLLLIIVVASVPLTGFLPAAAQVPTAPGEGGFILTSPSCSTFNREGVAETSFRSSEELVLRGTGFPAQTLILVTFRQGSLTAELGRFRTNDAGEFTSEPTLLRLPSGTTAGPATIQASSGGPSGACQVEMAATPAPAQVRRPDPEPAADDTNVWFAVWAIVLALGGGALTFVSYRRWQEQRLASAISRVGKTGRQARKRRYEAPPRLDSLSMPAPMPASSRPASSEGERTSPPVLPPGWDAGREPTPTRRPFDR